MFPSLLSFILSQAVQNAPKTEAENIAFLNQTTSCLQVYERELSSLEVPAFYKPPFAPMSYDPDGNGLACEEKDKPLWEKYHRDSLNIHSHP